MSHSVSILGLKRIESVVGRIASLDRQSQRQLLRQQLHAGKPLGSLGTLEQIALQLVGIQRTTSASIEKKTIVVIAADHGIADQSVSVYRPQVTAKVLRLMALGKAPINILASRANAKLVVVDMGIDGNVVGDGLVMTRKIAHGTENMAYGPAMTRAQAVRAINVGMDLAEEEAELGTQLVAVGEIGVGNSSAASAIASLMCGLPLHLVVGHGTGISDKQLQHKVRVLERCAQANNKVDSQDPISVLSHFGGFEIAGVTGFMLRAASLQVPVVFDGFISAVAAMIALSLAPNIRDYLIASHISTEPGHAHVLKTMGLKPLLSLGMRLGQASGAALAIPIIETACALAQGIGSIEDAGIGTNDRVTF